MKLRRPFTLACTLTIVGAAVCGMTSCGQPNTDEPTVEQEQIRAPLDAAKIKRVQDLFDKTFGRSAYDDVKAKAEDSSLDDTHWSFSSVFPSPSFAEFEEAVDDADAWGDFATISPQIDELEEKMAGTTISITDNQLEFTYPDGGTYAMDYAPSSKPGVYELTDANVGFLTPNLASLFNSCAVVDGNLVFFPVNAICAVQYTVS